MNPASATSSPRPHSWRAPSNSSTPAKPVRTTRLISSATTITPRQATLAPISGCLLGMNDIAMHARRSMASGGAARHAARAPPASRSSGREYGKRKCASTTNSVREHHERARRIHQEVNSFSGATSSSMQHDDETEGAAQQDGARRHLALVDGGQPARRVTLVRHGEQHARGHVHAGVEADSTAVSTMTFMIVAAPGNADARRGHRKCGIAGMELGPRHDAQDQHDRHHVEQQNAQHHVGREPRHASCWIPPDSAAATVTISAPPSRKSRW